MQLKYFTIIRNGEQGTAFTDRKKLAYLNLTTKKQANKQTKNINANAGYASSTF